MTYGGLGTLFTLSGGVPTPIDLAIVQEKKGQSVEVSKPLFLQISDAHIGFNNEGNPDVSGALKQTIDLVKSTPTKTALAIHTGDTTRLSKAQEFDLASPLLFELPVPELHTVPGEHDVTDDSSAEYFCRFGKASDNGGYYSFDHDSVHFVDRQRHASLQGKGSITFHTARSTAFPQPTAGNGPGPVPLTVVRDQMPRMRGVTTVSFAGHPGAPRFTIQQLYELRGDHCEKSFVTEIRICGRVLPGSVWSYSHGVRTKRERLSRDDKESDVFALVRHDQSRNYSHVDESRCGAAHDSPRRRRL